MLIFLIIQIAFDVAFLAAGISLAVIAHKKIRKNEESNAEIMKSVEDGNKLFNESTSKTLECIGEIAKASNKVSERVSDLEKGLVPNYEEAVKATDAVNSFVSGVNGIFSFDEIAALHKDDEPKGGNS